jgi:23S rRNA pseudouridine2605 synthase
MEERIQKLLSRAGVASRRKAEELIEQGHVTVNGRRVTELGTKVDPSKDEVRVRGALVADVADRVYYVLFKPAGCVTTLSDPEGRRTVADFLGRSVIERVYPVGRLDYDAEGALILTNDGDLAHRLMHPRFGARRTYLAKVKGEPSELVIERLRAGVRLEDGLAKPLEAEKVQRADKNTWIRLVVNEGRPHLVKRLCEAVGHPVVRLFRASYAGVSVEGMMAGELRELTRAEVKELQGGTARESAAKLPPRRDARRGVRKPLPKAAGARRSSGPPKGRRG